MAQDPTTDWYRDVPHSVRGQAAFGFGLMALFLGGFGYWAVQAPLAAAVIAQGSFVATGQNQILQHLEGGVIGEILVKEGDWVEAGQTILHLDETLARATKRDLYLRAIRQMATEARLLATGRGDQVLVFPDSLTALRDDLEINEVLAAQQPAFLATRTSLANDIAQVERNIAALEARRRGYVLQAASFQSIQGIFAEELANKDALMTRGLTSRDTITALQRASLDAQGQAARMEAEIEEIDRMREKYAAQIRSTHDKYREAALLELQAVQAELASLRENIRKAENVLNRTEVKAPVSGAIVRLHYHTPGGVIEPGRVIAEILPSAAPLIVETLIPRSDIDVVAPGQEASIRMVGLNQRTTPILRGKVDYVSADAVTRGTATLEREVYVLRASISPTEFARIPHVTLKSGMPVEIMIQTEARSFAQYLAKPILDSMSRAFREQ